MTTMRTILTVCAVAAMAGLAAPAAAGDVRGRVADATGAPLAGVQVAITDAAGGTRGEAVSDDAGTFRVPALADGRYTATLRAVNFATATRPFQVSGGGARLDVTLELSLSADVTVVGTRSFRNLADAPDPAMSLIGIARAASEGAVTAADLSSRPIQRAGEVLEAVPGLVVSQHTGEGKANQYYLRGFNLDHGTDFATTIAGLPINLPTHAHGQGYTDVNFLIPELVGGIQFAKGSYDVTRGDFSTAGSASVRYLNVLDRPLASVSTGGEGWVRALAAASPRLGAGHVLAAVEMAKNDGPWTRPDDYRRVNGLLRYSARIGGNAFSVTALGYRGRWNGTDQVPARAVGDGTISRFDGIDDTTGGRTSRAALVGEWQRTGRSTTTATVSLQRYDLDLFSNFTYFLDDPVNGDQIHQADRRWVGAARVMRQGLSRLGRRPVEWRFGLDGRRDAIGLVGLYHTAARQRVATVREDAVTQSAAAAFAAADVEWSRHVRVELGARGDLYRFDVRAAQPENGGTRRAGLVSPKAGLVLGPWHGTELYANAGLGFHSNDARGTTITVDPASGEAAHAVTPLVRARTAEVGVRTVRLPRTQVTAALWTLGLESEQLFVGDAGSTEAGRPSRRSGLEVSAHTRLRSWLVADGDLAWTRSRFTDGAPEGDAIPGAVGVVGDVGLTATPSGRFFASLRLRAFGPRALVEDGSARSRATRLVNGRVGLRLGGGTALVLDAFNVFDARASDIDYLYASRLPGEPAGGVLDRHFHPALPRTVRVSLTRGW